MSGEDFSELPALDLGRLTDEQLLDYVRAAQAAGHPRAQEKGLAELIGRYAETVLTWNLKVPADRREDMAHDILADAVKAVLDGKPIEKFSAWLSKVARNHVADFHRGKEGRQLKVDRSAAGLTADTGEDPPAIERAVEGDYGEAELWQLIDQILDRLSERHRSVIELYVFDSLSAREVSARSGESEANVFKIAQRFRDDLRRSLEAAEDGDTGEAA